MVNITSRLIVSLILDTELQGCFDLLARGCQKRFNQEIGQRGTTPYLLFLA